MNQLICDVMEEVENPKKLQSFQKQAKGFALSVFCSASNTIENTFSWTLK